MNLLAFTDELVRLQGGREALAKVAGTGSLFGRMGAIGAASGLGAHGIQSAKGMITNDPNDAPQGNVLGSVVRGGLGGLSIAGLIKLLEKAKGK